MAQDPDLICIAHAGEAIRPNLKSLGLAATKTQAERIARDAVHGWLKKRPPEWSRDRSIAHTGSPDLYNVGFAETILPVLAGGNHPFEKPVTEWSKDEMSLFLATAFELIEDQRVATLERDVKIPF
ncbi:MAG: hypothetical protein AAFV59_14335 [Pseudomonadota bacterium]